MINDPFGVPATPRPRGANDAGPPASPTIGLVTALPEEFVAMRALLDSPTHHQVAGDSTTYVIGTLPSRDLARPHNVALTLLHARAANASATGCHQVIRSFPSITMVIVVGVAAGVPNPLRPDRHVRLGDIVVATHGIVDSDHIRAPDEPELDQHVVPTPLRALDQVLEAIFQDSGCQSADLAAIRAASARRRDQPNQARQTSDALAPTSLRAPKPSPQLTHCVDLLRAEEIAGVRPWERWLDPSQLAELAGYGRPPEHTDLLHDSAGWALRHPRRSDSGHRKGLPKVHYGVLATSVSPCDTTVLAELTNRHGILAVEMEGAGIPSVLAGLEWLTVRGISDYGNNYGSGRWRRYAALAAAAYVRALLSKCIPVESPDRPTSTHSDPAVWPTSHHQM